MTKAEKRAKQRRIRIIVASAVVLGLMLVATYALSRSSIPVLQPAGPVAAGERQLMITASLLMLIVVIPVFVILFTVAWRYRETNTKATYKPDWDGNKWAETTWWVIPGGLIFVLAIITWRGTFQHDPYKPLAVKDETMIVQVVAMDWRWLFIYPEQQVASLNELRVPVNKSLQLEITADAPMNSFWIPQLGGQIYAMPGMGTRLHLMADRTGSFYGSSANISGRGFSNMNFQTIATSQQDFDVWVDASRQQAPLTKSTYDQIAKPSTDDTVIYYGQPAANLYSSIINKYMNMDHDSGGTH